VKYNVYCSIGVFLEVLLTRGDNKMFEATALFEIGSSEYLLLTSFCFETFFFVHIVAILPLSFSEITLRIYS
jgi:hypothetical protein